MGKVDVFLSPLRVDLPARLFLQMGKHSGELDAKRKRNIRCSILCCSQLDA
jgi:hypothetical protein